MFAKQPAVLSKNELPPDRRPGTLGSSSGLSSAQAAASPPLPLHPTLQNVSSASARSAPAPQADSPLAPDSAASGSRLIVGPDVKLKGAEILDCDTLIVEGRVEAVMDSRVIRITEQGSFNGKVGIDVAEIFGEFEGDLTARQHLIIHSTGRVHGKIRYGKLLVEEGGTLSGDIQSLNETLSGSQPRSISSTLAEKEANALMKSHLSTVAG